MHPTDLSVLDVKIQTPSTSRIQGIKLSVVMRLTPLQLPEYVKVESVEERRNTHRVEVPLVIESC